MNVLGISGLDKSVSFKKRVHPGLSPRHYRICQGFDAAAALVNEGGVHAAAAEERFTRQKTTGAFPVSAIRYCLEAAKLKLADVDCIAHGFNYEPYRDYYYQSELGRRQFDEVYSRESQLRTLQSALNGEWNGKFVQVPHHYAHAASTYFLSGMKDALVVVADGMGEQEGLTVAVGKDGRIEVLKQIPSIHSLGILYSVFTLYLGFEFNMDEYKVMGLAPYGNPRRYFDSIMSLVNLKPDGTHTIPVLFKNETEGEKETYAGTLRVLEEKFGPPRDPESEITRHHQDVAAGLQAVLQTALLHLLRAFRKETGAQNLCMAGGVALNCTANGVIKRSRLFKRMFVQPAAGDDGSALGAALSVLHSSDRELPVREMSLPLWGPEFTDGEIAKALSGRAGCVVQRFDSFDGLAGEVAGLIARGQIIGWFQGRMEFGPRALGSRSILADPRRGDMRDRINALVKKREEFRPFAPAVASDQASKFFEIDEGDETLFAHMLCVTHVREGFRQQLPAITHVDGSARVQTVNRDANPRFWGLLKAFEAKSGMPILLNTSFNVRGQPIVCTPTEAVDTFLTAGLDALVIGDYLVRARD
jgi:carbamoyltransferase